MASKKTDFESAVRAEIEQVKTRRFAAGYTASDEEALGIALAKFFDWDGLAILRTAQYALEDANFHTEAGQVSDMADNVESEG